MAFVALVATTVTAASPPSFTGKAVSVHDGDTLHVLDSANIEHTIRLEGIDAPERKQRFGTKSRDKLTEITKGKPVTVRPSTRDKYGRTAARLKVERQDVGERLVREPYLKRRQLCPDAAVFRDAL